MHNRGGGVVSISVFFLHSSVLSLLFNETDFRFFLGLYKEDYLGMFKFVSFDNKSFAISGKVGIPYIGFSTPVGWQ